MRVTHQIERTLTEDLRRRNLSLAQFDVLAHIGAAEGITQQALADGLLVTKGNICQLLDRLEQSQLLTRRKEGRTNRLYLTPQGRALYAELVPAHEALVAAQFDALTADEQIDLLALLRKVDRALARKLRQ
jgi:DNA-binding MarR family transcriptional regulator